MRGAADVHVFDEAHLGVNRFPVFDQIDQLVVVDAADDDGVELDAAEHAVRRGDAGAHRVELVEARQPQEPVRVQRVEADRDPLQPGVLERVGLIGEQDAVGGQREIVDAAFRRQQPHERRAGRGAAAARRR